MNSMKILNRLKLCLTILICLSFFSACSSDDDLPIANNPVVNDPNPPSDVFYKGTTMGFVKHQEEFGNVIFKENGEAKDPFVSVKEHGGNIVRFRIDLPPYSNNYTQGKPDVDFRKPAKVKSGMQRALSAGLKTQLTFSYKSMALESQNSKNVYVAPLAWQPIANNLSKLKDSVYNHTYTVLEDYVTSGIIPEIVSIGNETNWHVLLQNVEETNLPNYNPSRTVSLLNSGSNAVRDINENYSLDIKIAVHIFSASNLEWWMNEHVPLGLDFDIMGLSHYHDWHSLGDFTSWTAVVNWVKTNYNKDFLILETAQLFTTNGYDNHVNILGTGNIPPGYVNPPTTATQRLYLGDFAQEILDAGGLGLIVWGGEWVGSNTLIYADEWGAGSSWENKTFWDENHNLHDGINWMMDVE